MVTLALLAAVHAVGIARGEFTVAPAPRPGAVTSITKKGEVAAEMGLAMTPVPDRGDSVEWWERRQAGWNRWLKTQRLYPRARSPKIEGFLAGIAEGFNQILPQPDIRFHFYVADSLNPSIWPAGGGFFLVHAGIFRAFPEEIQFAYIMSLELAHELLGHNFMHLRAGDVNWEPGSWREGDTTAWPIEFWAVLAGADPLARGGLQYTLKQESEALELVYHFFTANGWDFDGTGQAVVDRLKSLEGDIPGATSLPGLHPKLALARMLPFARPKIEKIKFIPMDWMLGGGAYAEAVKEIARSPLQHYPWMLELAPYHDLLPAVGPAEAPASAKAGDTRKPHGGVAQTPSGEDELSDLDDLNEDLDSRDALPSARLARAYARGLILLAHGRWEEAVANATAALKIEPRAEPFLWQRARARQQQERFNKCIIEMGDAWPFFEHRRQLLETQCTFLEGRYTDALNIVAEYRKRYPFDAEGAFWQTLAMLRLGRSIDRGIEEIDAFWGDRPMVRALEVFRYGLRKQPTRAHERLAMEVDPPDIDYLPQEWGMLHLAHAWLRGSFEGLRGDEPAEHLQRRAESEWELARLVRRNFPNESVQQR